MYTKITDPTTNKTVSIHSLEGKKLIQNYINFLKGGSVPIAIAALTSPIGISIGGSLAVLAGGAWVVTYYKSKNNPEDKSRVGVARLVEGLELSPVDADVDSLKTILERARETNADALSLLKELGGAPVSADEQTILNKEAEEELELLMTDGEEEVDSGLLDDELEALFEEDEEELTPSDEELLEELDQEGGSTLLAAGIVVAIVTTGTGVWAILTGRGRDSQEVLSPAQSISKQLKIDIDGLMKNIQMAQNNLDSAQDYKQQAFVVRNDPSKALPLLKRSNIQKNARNQLCIGCESLRKGILAKFLLTNSKSGDGSLGLDDAQEKIMARRIIDIKQKISDIKDATI